MRQHKRKRHRRYDLDKNSNYRDLFADIERMMDERVRPMLAHNSLSRAAVELVLSLLMFVSGERK